MIKLTIDFETRSEADLKSMGATAYAMHPSTEVICLAMKLNGEDPSVWMPEKFRKMLDPFHELPLMNSDTVRFAIEQADVIEAHNAAFEHAIWKYTMPKYGFTEELPLEKLRCSAAKAASHGLPRDLDSVCRVLGVDQLKDSDGSRLMLRMCKPRKPRKAEMLADPDYASKVFWHEEPGDLVRLAEYCMQDVRAEEAASEALSDLSPEEQELWLRDLRINDRGIPVDVEACAGAVDCIERHSADLLEEFSRITGLSSPKQVGATLQWLQERKVLIFGLDKHSVSSAFDFTEEGEEARRVLEIRQSLSKSSTAKYESFLAVASVPDHRARGCFMYHGAATGRWTGRLLQPQNFPRGTFKDAEGAVELFRAGDLDGVKLFYGDPMEAASSCLRSMICAPDGKDFICADYSSIEGRVLAWLADEQSALDVYREGRDPYRVAAAAIYHCGYDDIPKSDPRRQIGKVAELALGYQGGRRAFDAMAENYGVDLPEREVKEIVSNWRDSRPKTVQLWRELEHCAVCAVTNRGQAYTYGKLSFKANNRYLAMLLPSGRVVYYANPRLETKTTPWGEEKSVVVYDTVDSVTRKWGPAHLYGGLITENATQAVARDLLANGLRNVEDAGYPVVLHVHDEAMSEVPTDFGSVEEYEQLMCQLPPWAEDLPLKAEGWRGKRYKK